MTTPAQSEKTATPLRIRPLIGDEDLYALRSDVDVLALDLGEKSRYIGGFAVSRLCKERVFRLRYEVFNLELGEGLESAAVSGLDRDEYDDQMTHLVVVERATNAVVGTYRVQTAAHARKHLGLYSEQEFDLSGLGDFLEEAVECGRACIARNHRSVSTLFVLWKGLLAFTKIHNHRWLFGCCSLTSHDPDDGWRAMKTIRERDVLHPELRLTARAPYSCGAPEREFDEDLGDPVRLPKLFNMYIRAGAKVISEPAIDRDFGTVDFLIIMNTTKVAGLESLSVSDRLRGGEAS